MGLISLLIGCSGSRAELPKENPEEVVKRFYFLLSQKGKAPAAEARKLISTKYGNIEDDTFMRWTEQFDPETKIKIIDSSISNKRDAKGNILAKVTVEYSVPSIFGSPFTSKSQTNLILDEEEKRWKIDFTAETKDEDGFRKAG
ncbi:MAG: hypothetical protein A3F81_06355 [Nitrospinae bacterium RIFCSPLOWO2_12_FULL_39_93]|nr:MAG: hypothetical protein A3F81_06355 [Nitrospinae bacterium RIFCSPLOWO2_12_FULL_39_93]